MKKGDYNLNPEDLEEFDSWRKEPEKIRLLNKYYEATLALEYAYRYPSPQTLKDAFSKIMGYIIVFPDTYQPPKHNKTKQEIETEIEEFNQTKNVAISTIDDIKYIIYARYHSPGENNKLDKLMKQYGVGRILSKNNTNTGWEYTLYNIPNLVDKLRNIHMQMGQFATTKGLRLTQKQKRSTGFSALEDMEGFED